MAKNANRGVVWERNNVPAGATERFVLVRYDANGNPTEEVSRDQHDVLVLKAEQLFRAMITKADDSYQDAGVLLQQGDLGRRKVGNIAGRGNSTVDFGLIPIRPEPASEFICCFLTRPDRLKPAAEFAEVAVVTERTNHLAHFPMADSGEIGKPTSFHPSTSQAKQVLEVERGIGLSVGANTQAATLFLNGPNLHFVNPWTSVDWTDKHDDRPVPKMWSWNQPELVLRRGGQDFLISCDAKGGVRTQPLQAGEEKELQRLLGLGAALGEVLLTGAKGALPFVNLDCFQGGSHGRLLLALGDGRIVDVNLDKGSHKAVDVLTQPELWRLLRNGSVFGTTLLASESEPVMFVNLSSFAGELIDAPPAQEGIGGTLDFRWPQYAEPNQKLRVRLVQAGPWEEAYPTIESCLHEWLDATSLKFDFAPWNPEDPAPYDILINVERLDGKVRKSATHELPIKLPMSDLGSYALRQRLGEPTAWLGYPPNLKGVTDELDYIKSPAFRHIALHELGHALGLPHLHHHPDGLDPFDDPDEAVRQVKDAMGIDIKGEDFRSEYVVKWNINRRYSLWPELPKLKETKAASEQDPGNQAKKDAFDKNRRFGEVEDSVMLGLPARQILKSGEARNAPPVYSAQLTKFDHDWIQKLYPR